MDAPAKNSTAPKERSAAKAIKPATRALSVRPQARAPRSELSPEALPPVIMEWAPASEPPLELPPLELTPLDGDDEALYRRLHGKHPSLAIYKRNELPARLHYRDNARIPAIIGIPDDGWAVVSSERLAERELSAGAHGYDPANRSMASLFVTAGPTLRRGLVVKPFENIHVYDLMCAVLKLAPAPNDGDPAATRAFLR